MLIKYMFASKSQKIACGIRFSLPADRFHSEMGARFAFT